MLIAIILERLTKIKQWKSWWDYITCLHPSFAPGRFRVMNYLMHSGKARRLQFVPYFFHRSCIGYSFFCSFFLFVCFLPLFYFCFLIYIFGSGVNPSFYVKIKGLVLVGMRQNSKTWLECNCYNSKPGAKEKAQLLLLRVEKI